MFSTYWSHGIWFEKQRRHKLAKKQRNIWQVTTSVTTTIPTTGYSKVSFWKCHICIPKYVKLDNFRRTGTADIRRQLTSFWKTYTDKSICHIGSYTATMRLSHQNVTVNWQSLFCTWLPCSQVLPRIRLRDSGVTLMLWRLNQVDQTKRLIYHFKINKKQLYWHFRLFNIKP